MSCNGCDWYSRHAQERASAAKLEGVRRMEASFAVVQWLIRIGGQCRHRESIRTVSGARICIVCNEEVTRAR